MSSGSERITVRSGGGCLATIFFIVVFYMIISELKQINETLKQCPCAVEAIEEAKND